MPHVSFFPSPSSSWKIFAITSLIFSVLNGKTILNQAGAFTPAPRSLSVTAGSCISNTKHMVFHGKPTKIRESIMLGAAGRPSNKEKEVGKLISKKRREQLGISEDEDEYDLGMALDQNTDPLITKVIAGSLILVILGLLVAGVVVPSLTDYGEGVCSPIQNGGRC